MRIAIDTNRYVDFAKGLTENDLWIAALVVQHQAHLFARDTHFDHLPQIPRL